MIILSIITIIIYDRYTFTIVIVTIIHFLVLIHIYYLHFVLAVLCAPGSYYDLTAYTCQLCPLAQYQDGSGQTYCKTCPNQKYTKDMGTNSTEGCISKFYF